MLNQSVIKLASNIWISDGKVTSAIIGYMYADPIMLTLHSIQAMLNEYTLTTILRNIGLYRSHWLSFVVVFSQPVD